MKFSPVHILLLLIEENIMKKRILLCALCVVMLGLFTVSQAAAFSFEFSCSPGNYSEEAERDWLNNVINGELAAYIPGQGDFGTYNGTGATVETIYKWLEMPDNAAENFDWSASLPATLSAGDWILWKDGASVYSSCQIYAFLVEEGDEITTYQQLIEAIASLLNTQFGLTLTVDQYKNATSHISSNLATPIPAAAWLLGSGLLGLVGVQRWRRRR